MDKYFIQVRLILRPCIDVSKNGSPTSCKVNNLTSKKPTIKINRRVEFALLCLAINGKTTLSSSVNCKVLLFHCLSCTKQPQTWNHCKIKTNCTISILTKCIYTQPGPPEMTILLHYDGSTIYIYLYRFNPLVMAGQHELEIVSSSLPFGTQYYMARCKCTSAQNLMRKYTRNRAVRVKSIKRDNVREERVYWSRMNCSLWQASQKLDDVEGSRANGPCRKQRGESGRVSEKEIMMGGWAGALFTDTWPGPPTWLENYIRRYNFIASIGKRDRAASGAG